jgi:hypothetical protein
MEDSILDIEVSETLVYHEANLTKSFIHNYQTNPAPV